MLVQELATRINHAKPKVVLAGSCGIEPSGVIPYQPLVNSAIELATHKPEKVRGTGGMPAAHVSMAWALLFGSLLSKGRIC
jgi:acyl-coenzyme A synthetase/AMP-(fatty) acid ligase